MKETDPRPTVVVAGASGFVGRALGACLAERFRLVGLTRDTGNKPDGPYIWRACDLFSRYDTREALMDADYAVYLVHSMQPSARLTQGNFRDMDLICADNFARAAAAHGVEQIVYLSGMIPETDDPESLSRHLSSRYEVEKALGARGTPVTAVRAGIVVGPGGSSTEMVIKLVERLPAMICPAWTRTRTQMIALEDVVAVISWCLANEEVYGEDFDVGHPEILTYEEMLRRTAEVMDYDRKIRNVDLITPKLSTLWVATMTGQPTELVRPLVESLKHEMIVRDDTFMTKAIGEPIGFDEAIRKAIELDKPEDVIEPGAFRKRSKALVRQGQPNHVRSVQRLPLPPGRDARWVAEEYARWLPQALRPIINVAVDDDGTMHFKVFCIPWPLLTLRFASDVSKEDRHLYWIRGGMLASPSDLGRLEFREVLDGEYVLAAIHEFHPRLPWLIYTWTQALFHVWVMWRYGRHLRREAKSRQLTVEEASA